MSMQPANEPVVHSYDTERHAIRCGAAGQMSSTKHARGVTCRECLRLLADESVVPDDR
jgi:hypothetical protein